MELGISSFGEVNPDHVSGGAKNAHLRVQQLLEEIKLADEVGLDVFALGEHHRPDYVVSAPEIILSAAAATTKNIKLSSAVTVLSSADPVRVFQNFSSLDLVSNGRAEIMAGRGSFIESFPLFGYDLSDYDALFSEKLELLLKLNESEKINWQGHFRPSIDNRGVYPRPLQEKLPIWLAVGGTPASAARAGALNIPMTVAIIGGTPERFVPFIQLFRQSAEKAGHDVSKLPLAINSHFYTSDTYEKAMDEFFPPYELTMNRVGRERGWSPIGRDYVEFMQKSGPLMVGSPQQIIDKIMYFYELFQQTRYLAQLVGGHMIPHTKVLRAIELFGTEVAPVVRKEIAKKQAV
ncbi:Atu2307/SP_0267 family LLM class monooxygenase [Siphonobacter sp. SORGH_AS_0500]|uniref:Atu2307/SP_0267 family LLM class monooxygenase n=1 Tax=Siphonobacter sp. SORGH_AS_0500 TaxID=1864824 RepID=UPI00285A0B51|nr:Atu2307/SP_0267 family LLM class monooxygenase [Siphonobacter sp. SORGH_AS_0500]MDR6196087.1 putative LLM family oxidoreductase [Siphonobacter sp. SORGH_AS_0500]